MSRPRGGSAGRRVDFAGASRLRHRRGDLRLRYQRNDATTISSVLADAIVAHRHLDDARRRLATTLGLDAGGAIRLATAPIAGADEHTFPAGLDEIDEA
jgi:hypothetical protein